jgi:hypothetical protein
MRIDCYTQTKQHFPKKEFEAFAEFDKMMLNRIKSKHNVK